MDPLAEATERLIRAGRRLGARGLISAGEGNLSIRLDADRLLVTPSGRARMSWHPTTSSSSGSATRSAMPCRAAGRGPTSDLAIHLAVHAARPDIGAVAHAHLPAAMALTLAGEVPDPSALPETALLPAAPAVPVARDPGERRAGRPHRGCSVRAAGAARLAPSSSSATARWPSAVIPTRRSTASSSSRSCAGPGATRS